MQTMYFRQLRICTEFTLKWHISETEAIVAKTSQCLLVLQCMSSVDSLLGENLVLVPQPEKKLTQAKLLPLAECRKWIFWLTHPHTKFSPTSLIYNLLWDTSSKYRWRHAVQISDSACFHFWTHSQIHALLLWSLFFLWCNTTMDRFVLFPPETLLMRSLTFLTLSNSYLSIQVLNPSYLKARVTTEDD